MDKQEPKYRSLGLELESSSTSWQESLLKLPQPHPLQSWQWGEFKSRWGWQALPFLMRIGDSPDQKKTLAAALVLKRRLPRTSFSVLYVPKGPLLDYKRGPLRRVVLSELEQISRIEKAVFIKIDPNVVQSWGVEDQRRTPIGHKFSEELISRGWRFSREQIQFRNTVELDLMRNEDELLAKMKQKTRYNIRLAGRKDITVRPGTPDDFKLIAEMYQTTAARDGFAVRPVEYYLDAWQTLYRANLAQPLLAEFEGQPLAAVIIVRYGKRAIYMYGASTNRERKRMPNYLLQWEAIRWAKAQGCDVYDFWGAPDNFVEEDPLWGVWRFKEGFRGQVVQHIGAWDFVARPFWYWIYTVIIPKYINFLRSLN